MPDLRQRFSPIARRDWAYAGHACLCASMLLWRTIEATPSLSSTHNGSFPSSPLGVSATMILVWLGVASLIAAVGFTCLAVDDLRLWILVALMWLSLLWRREIDVFDISYVASVAILCVWWFNAGRARALSAAGPPAHGADPRGAKRDSSGAT